jgi:hypothetical protein
MKKRILFSLFFVLGTMFSAQLFAQDVIIKKNGDKINVVIKELSDTEVKYTNYKDPNGIIFTMDRALIREIKFSYGGKIKEEGPNQDESYYIDDKRNNIKLNFTAISVGWGILTYERSLNPSSSIEASIKIPGLGITRDDQKLSGLGLNAGYKLKLGSIFQKEGYRPKHLLHGKYFRPNLGYTFTKTTNENGSGLGNDRATVNRSFINFGLDFGSQYILNNVVSLDWYFGFHYYGGGIDKIVQNGNNIPVDAVSGDYIDLRGGDMVGGGNVAFNIGLRVGILFDSKDDPKKKKRR